MKKVMHYLLLLGVVFLLKLISVAFSASLKEAAKDNLVVTAVLLAVAAIYLVISYSQHRKEANNAASEAIRIANEPGAKENDWAPLMYESKKRWKGNALLVTTGISVFSSFLGSLADVFLFTDVSDLSWSAYTAPIIASLLKLGWDHLEESRECREFEELLKAANEGHWVPAPELPEEDTSVKGKVREFIHDLPKEVLDSAADSLRRE
jgi:hypothetical protein